MALASSVLPRITRDALAGPAPEASLASAFPPSMLTLLVGEAANGAVERLILDAAAQSKSALLVCGDNHLDAYRLLAHARSLGLEDAVADGVLLARAFTVHQFVALVDEALPLMALERSDAGVAIVTGLLEPFLDEDVRDAESHTLLKRCLRALVKWTSTTGFPVVATMRRPDSARASDLLALACGLTARRVDAETVGGGLAGFRSRQMRLDAFAAVEAAVSCGTRLVRTLPAGNDAEAS